MLRKKLEDLNKKLKIFGLCTQYNPNKIYEYVLNNDLNKYEMDKMVRAICTIKNAEYIYKFIVNIHNLTTDNIKDLINALTITKEITFINKVTLSNNKLINFDDIVNGVSLYSSPKLIFDFFISCEMVIGENNVKKLLSRICELKDIRYIILAASKSKTLMEDDIDPIIDILIENDKIKDIIEFIRNCTKIKKEKLDEIICSFVKLDYTYALYEIAKIYKERYNKNSELLIDEILKRKNMKYICLVLVYLDNSLIYKYFKNVNSLYEYMEYSGFYSDNEIRIIRREIYGDAYHRSIKDSENKIYKYRYLV